MKKNIPLAAMERILKQLSNDVRVGDDAKEALRDVLEDIAKDIGAAALKFANHAGRKTIKADDINLAAKEL
ncbi:MAG: histone [archaeon]